MTEAARLVDELTTLLYEVTTGWDDSAGGHQIVRCGACRRRADRAESVVHDSDCPVYRLIRAEEANTAVIRANADEIADLEDRRDELEERVNALTARLEAAEAALVRKDRRCSACYTPHECLTPGSECVCESFACIGRRRAALAGSREGAGRDGE